MRSAHTPHTMTTAFRIALLPFLVAVPVACGGGGGSSGGGGGGGGGGGTTATLDCDYDGVEDAVQIAAGAADVDQDGILDSCEVAARATTGLVSAVGAVNSARVWWRVPSQAADLPARLAVFYGTDPATIYSATAVEVTEASGSLDIAGLTSNTTYQVALAARNTANTAWEPLGPVLSLRTGLPLYLNPQAAAGGDGLTPATAFQALPSALAATLTTGRQAIWMSEGSVSANAQILNTGVHLVGGFTTAFTLAARDPRTKLSRLQAVDVAGTIDPSVLIVRAGVSAEAAVVDGVRIFGLPTTTSGIESSTDPVQIRSTVVTQCVRGIRLRSLPDAGKTDAVVAGCTVVGATADGLSVDGSFELWVDNSDFESCGAEGVAFGKLYAPAAEVVSLDIRGCRFSRNGQEGLDLQLAAPPVLGAGIGEFRITLVDCDAIDNALDGVRIDLDYETAAGWTSRIQMRGVTAHSNVLAGVHLDLDADASVFAHRLACSANGTDGFQVTSEPTFGGVATLASSAMWGNGGAGARALSGKYTIKATHCAFAGNAQGALVSAAVGSTVLNSGAEAHSTTFTGSTSVNTVVRTNHDALMYVNAPLEYARITAINGSSVSLASPSANGVGTQLELANDGVARAVTSTAAQSLSFGQAAPRRRVPAQAWFLGTADATESWAPAAAGILQGQGWTGPTGGPRDCGPLGAPLAGAPGAAGAQPPKLFYVAKSSPVATSTVTLNQTLSLSFVGGTPNAATLANGVVVRRGGNAQASATATVVTGTVRVTPPTGGWLDGDRVELHAALAATDGTALAAPYVWVIDVQ